MIQTAKAPLETNVCRAFSKGMSDFEMMIFHDDEDIVVVMMMRVIIFVVDDNDFG